MNDIIENSDLKKIIHNLILFIVVDAKQYLAQDKLNDYIVHYTNYLIHVMNNIPTNDSNHTIVEVMKIMEEDIRDNILS